MKPTESLNGLLVDAILTRIIIAYNLSCSGSDYRTSFRKIGGLRDLAGRASVLSKARRPAEVPKTIILCRTKNDTAKVYSLLQSLHTPSTVGSLPSPFSTIGCPSDLLFT